MYFIAGSRQKCPAVKKILPADKIWFSSLKSNIERRFEDCLRILKSFSIFNPLMLSSPESDEFKDYGERSIITLADHFYDGNDLRKNSSKLNGESSSLIFWLGKMTFQLQ